MAELNFDGRVAIITGGGAGLGKTYALELARRGAKVVVNDLGGDRHGTGANSSAADIVVDEIKAAGGEAAANYDSVATMEGGANMVKTAVDNFGKVDIVISNAGIIRDKSFSKMEEEQWDAVIAVHLKGAFTVTRAAWPYLKENNFGRVILTCSGGGLFGNFGQANYSAAKMGMIGFMNTLRLEGAKNNILINAIAPLAASRMTEDLLPPEVLAKMNPKYVTPMVTYLSSEQCTDSGMIFNCCGGWYSRTAIMCCDGAIIGDGKRDVKAEEIMDNWGEISGLEGAKTLGSLGESFGYLDSLGK